MVEPFLEALAAAAGIEQRYWDIHGGLHETSPETAQHLLKALGFRADTAAGIEAGLLALSEESWRQILAPVIVARQGVSVQVPLVVPSSREGTIAWTIMREHGDQSGGEIRVQDMAVRATRMIDGQVRKLFHLELPPQPAGYHHLSIRQDEDASAALIVSPGRCHLPGQVREWGISTQLYAVRSHDDWGIGDFGSLGRLVDWASAHGASMISLNPLHALFLESPVQASPYYPSSRLFLNPLYLDIAGMEDFTESERARTFAAHLADVCRPAREAQYIAYPVISAAKLGVLEELFRHFQLRHGAPHDQRGQAFNDFLQKGGSPLRQFAIFQLLSEQLGTHEWRGWPDTLRSPTSQAVNQIAGAHRERLLFFQYLQWQCELQLSSVAERGRSRRLGLCRDFAVSVATSGCDYWCNQQVFLPDTGIGAPPDPFNEAGQGWGLAALSPRALRAVCYSPFIAWLRANMRHASALRIDHILGWQRLFAIPDGARPADGAYLNFPIDDLLAIAALESVRAHCSVIGEDLGTVPAGFGERIRDAGILSTRILYFEKEGGHFRAPDALPSFASLSASNHDLATLHGFWTGADIAAKEKAGVLRSPGDRDAAIADRQNDKRLLLEALKREGLLPEGFEPGAGVPWSRDIGDAIHVYLARSSCALVALQLDDLADEEQQINLPGTSSEYPNWQRRIQQTLDELAANPAIERTIRAVALARQGPCGS